MVVISSSSNVRRTQRFSFRCAYYSIALLVLVWWVWILQSFQTISPATRATGSISKSEHASSMEYIHSIKSFDRTLKFFHIPKTAGTAIEQAAGDKVAWGSCLFKHKPIVRFIAFQVMLIFVDTYKTDCCISSVILVHILPEVIGPHMWVGGIFPASSFLFSI